MPPMRSLHSRQAAALVCAVVFAAGAQPPLSNGLFTDTAAEQDEAERWLGELSQEGQDCIRNLYPKRREGLPALLNCLELRGIGVEVGVQTGRHAASFLDIWQGHKMLLVDRWQSISNSSYVDIANGRQVTELPRAQCEQMMSRYAERVEIRPLWSTDAAATVANASLDFVYLDARHDFCGVLADMVSWWPKLRDGGVFAGHDYCDGEMPEGDFAVRSAAIAFFGEPAPVLQTREWQGYRSFFIVKTPRVDARVNLGAVDEAHPRVNLQAKYFSIYTSVLAEHAASHTTADLFYSKCMQRCTKDCQTRTDRVSALASGNSAQPIAYDSLQEESMICVGARARNNMTNLIEFNSTKYLDVCAKRCGITCEQRLHYFESFDDAALSMTGQCPLQAGKRGCTGACSGLRL